jgi:hypothetical protein
MLLFILFSEAILMLRKVNKEFEEKIEELEKLIDLANVKVAEH